MFKLKRENGRYILTDRLTNYQLHGAELTNLLFIAQATYDIRQQIAAGSFDGELKVNAPMGARQAGKNMAIVQRIVEQGVNLQQGTKVSMGLSDVCETCGGTGELDSPAENRGGNIVGPDTRPCPDCQYTEPDDFSGASEGDR